VAPRKQLPLFPSAPRVQEYRTDGWPLCPTCGEDELFPIDVCSSNTRAQHATWRAHVEALMRTDPVMHCYLCHFEGRVGGMRCH
jgi:hypothetical protein